MVNISEHGKNELGRYLRNQLYSYLIYNLSEPYIIGVK